MARFKLEVMNEPEGARWDDEWTRMARDDEGFGGRAASGEREGKRTFWVRARWDSEAQVYWSESDIRGLHIEAATLDEFQDVLREVVPDLIAANHGEEELYETEREWRYAAEVGAHGGQLLRQSG